MPPAVPATLTATLDNATGYFTKGAGSALGPGARFRLQWRATTGDAWTTRYTGRLSERRIRFLGSSRITTRWYGVLIHLTGSNLPSRTYGERTPDIIMGEICDAAGVPATDRDFDTDIDTVAITTSEGYTGVLQFADLVDAFIYDTPDSKVRMELPATRAAKAISASYTDTALTGTEIEIPPPEVLTNPFGIINHVQGELRIFSPAAGDDGIQITFPDQLRPVVHGIAWTPFSLAMPLGFLASDGVMVEDYSITCRIRLTGNFPFFEFTIAPPATSGMASVTISGNQRRRVEIRNLLFTISGDTITLTFEVRGWNYFAPSLSESDLQPPHPSDPPFNSLDLRNMSATVRDLYAVLQHMDTYPYAAENQNSQNMHGVQRRQMTLVVSEFVPNLALFTADLTELQAQVQAELERHSTAHDAYIVETTAATDAERTSLLARRLSDKVHLRLAGESQLSVDADFFVEAMQTTITPEGNATQRLHVVEDLGFVALAQLSAPTGLALTESGGDITATWDAVANATGYVLEWREEGSSGAWQTANVSSPPHTFTP